MSSCIIRDIAGKEVNNEHRDKDIKMKHEKQDWMWKVNEAWKTRLKVKGKWSMKNNTKCERKRKHEKQDWMWKEKEFENWTCRSEKEYIKGTEKSDLCN